MPTGIYIRQPVSDITRQRIGKASSIALLGNIPWNKGIKTGPNPEHSVRMKGRKLTLAHIDKVRKALKGKRNALGTIRSEEFRRKVSQTLGNNQGWISFKPYSFEWTSSLRRSIRERDKYLCNICSKYGNNVHHIDYNKKNCNPNNLITLCRSCHSKTNHNREKWKKYFKVN